MRQGKNNKENEFDQTGAENSAEQINKKQNEKITKSPELEAIIEKLKKGMVTGENLNENKQIISPKPKEIDKGR